MHARSIILVTLLTLTFGARPPQEAGATTVADMDLREMTAASSSIVHGAVLSSSSHWNDDRTFIVTDVRVRVLDVYKGAAANEIVVTQPGGTVGKLRIEVPGAAEFKRDEETVLFLAPDASGGYQVAGLSYGRFAVVTDPETRAKTVRGLRGEDIHVMRGLAPKDSGGPPLPDDGKGVPLNTFSGTLRQLVDRIAAEGGR